MSASKVFVVVIAVVVVAIQAAPAKKVAFKMLNDADAINLDTVDVDMPFLIYSLGGPLKQAFDITAPHCSPWIDRMKKRAPFNGKLNSLYDALVDNKNMKLLKDFAASCNPEPSAEQMKSLAVEDYQYDSKEYDPLSGLSDDEIAELFAEAYY